MCIYALDMFFLQEKGKFLRKNEKIKKKKIHYCHVIHYRI